jgi:carboxymethylenebutenolidase
MERKHASDYPQELLDLFNRYVHGEVDRRGFMDGAKKFAIGGLTAAAIFESLRPNYAWAQQVPKDDGRIKTESATVASPQGNGSIKGYLARPANAAGKLPGVLVIHENRGLNSSPSRRTVLPVWAAIRVTTKKARRSSAPWTNPR